MPSFTCFNGSQRLARGGLAEVALAFKHACDAGADALLVFDDATGRTVDLETRGSDEEVARRYAERPPSPPVAERRGPGRPKLGVVAREVTLLPRHWEWLSSQPGGASVALRRLVEQARKANRGADALRQARERSYQFMVTMAGDRPGFEEASRALFAGDAETLRRHIAEWPDDIRRHALELLNAGEPEGD